MTISCIKSLMITVTGGFIKGLLTSCRNKGPNMLCCRLFSSITYEYVSHSDTFGLFVFLFYFFCNLHGYNHAFFKDKCIFRMNQVMVYIPRLYFRSFSDNMVMCKCV